MALVAYGLAGLLGLAAALSMFPAWALVGGLPTGRPPRADFAQHVVGQLYFVGAGWHWPLLVDRRLDDGFGGTNIAFTDSIPLVAIVLKLLHPLCPGVRQSISLYQAAAW